MRLPSLRAGLPVAIGLILLATLYPGEAAWEPEIACIVCGGRGLADALGNILLFVPLGLGLGLTGLGLRRALLIGALLSCAIEGAQLLVPGRDPSIGDVLSNTLGTGAGVGLVRSARFWLAPDDRVAARLAAAAALVVGTVFLTTGLLLSPSFPRSSYWGQWTANLGHLEWYRGRVLSATVGSVPVPSGQLKDSDAVRRLLIRGDSIAVRALAGPPISALGPLFSIYDGEQREIILLGPDRDDLVFRYRTRATALRLDQLDLRLRDGMRDILEGDTIAVRADVSARGTCLAINAARRCGLGYSIGRGWGLLYYAEALPAWLKGALDLAWLAVLVLPVGFWMRRTWESAVATAVVALALLLVPRTTVLLPSSFVELLGVATGWGAGMYLGLRVRRSARSADST